ncbi:MAG: GTP-binding protein [Ignavibacteriaceae bacterium]|nr:GTP-binding protein [Ignavibacteriaceae bacterium]
MNKSHKQDKKRIVFIGKRNVGKSSLVNAFLGKEACTVNGCHAEVREALEVPMELPPYGSVVIVDTIPIADAHDNKIDALNKNISLLPTADFVIVVLDAREKLSQEDKSIFSQLKKLSIPFLVAVNKIEFGINSDLINGLRANNTTHFEISCKENVGVDALKARITRMLQTEPNPSIKK